MEINAVAKKLGIKKEFKVLVYNSPATHKDFLQPLPEGVEILKKATKQTADVVLLFATNKSDLEKHFDNVLSALKDEGNLWIAYPKGTSKIKTDISRDHGWGTITAAGYRGISLISIDDTWSALRFKKLDTIQVKTSQSNPEEKKYIDTIKRIVTAPEDLQKVLNKNQAAKVKFDSLSFTNKKEFVLWIISAKKEETRTIRLDQAVEKLLSLK